MRIGELSSRTGASPRVLRYYEQEGLIGSGRLANGYRDYDDRVVDRVLQVRALLEAGLPTRIIRLVLPCLSVPGVLVCEADASPAVLAALEAERDRLAVRAEALAKNRDALDAYLSAVAARTPRAS